MRVRVIGAGRLGHALAADLVHAGHEVRILDESADRVARLPAALRSLAVPGSPLDRDALSGALAGCDAVATVTGDDAVNAVVALAARRELRVPLAVAVIGNPARAQALVGLGAHILCPTARIVRDLHITLTRSGLESELPLGRDAGVYRAEVPSRLAGRTLRELQRPGDLVPVAVERAGRVLLAAPDLMLASGDVLHVAAADRRDLADLMRP